MANIKYDTSDIRSLISESDLAEGREALEKAIETLKSGSGPGSDFLGWRDILKEPNDALLSDITETAEAIREKADVLICIGIGGSYLGAQAVLDAMLPSFGRTGPEVIFLGHHLGGAYTKQLLDYLEGKEVYVNVISKSGQTLEPSVSFRIMLDWLKFNTENPHERVIATTDPESGALNLLIAEHGWKKYVIPRDIGGRFSVLTPVGLVPLAIGGVDVRSMYYGAVSAYNDYENGADTQCDEYALVRFLMHEEGYKVEALAHFEPTLNAIGGWWQQLFAESEGKDGKGLFPVCLQYTTDLHSVGQYLQDGQRTIFETFLIIDQDSSDDMEVPYTEANLEGLNYTAGRTISYINKQAYLATRTAHKEGGVPVASIHMANQSAETMGQLIYFFERAVALSAYMIGVNPFDQPGVEAYKKEMFSLLGRPGY